jgi:hypothetical protein
VARKALDDLPWPDRVDGLRRAGVRFVVTDEDLPAPYAPLGGLGTRDVRLFTVPDPAPDVRLIDGGALPPAVIAERAHSLHVRVDTPTAATLVWSRSAFPAWRAWVDGARVETRVVEGHLLGVPVPAGSHDVRIAWPAGPLIAGGIAWVLGLGALVGLRRG